MAFQQPTAFPSAKAIPAISQHEDQKPSRAPVQSLPEPQEWILFPSSRTLSHRQRPSSASKPANQSHLSDFGSLNSPIRASDTASAATLPYQTTLGSSADEDEETDELDSLVDGLNAFHNIHPSTSTHPSRQQGSGHIFPHHDGLGTFQDQIRQFEKHNPLRNEAQAQHARRSSSVKRKLDELEKEGDGGRELEKEKRERIENWRLDHSRILLGEIERETKRRQQQQSERSRSFSKSTKHDQEETGGSGQNTPLASPQQDQLKDKDHSFLNRLTSRILQNLLGIDENTLSILFGESLPPPPSHISSSPQAGFDPLALLTRLAHLLLPPPASQAPVPPLSYAGIPVPKTEPTSSRTHPPGHSRSPLSQSTAPQHWGIEDTPSASSPADHLNPETLLSILRLHLLPSTHQTHPSHHRTSTPIQTGKERAESIRRIHPLVRPPTSPLSSMFPSTQQSRLRSGRGGRWGRRGGRAGGGSSCRSQSIRTATSTTSAGSYAGAGGGSSRCYWDIGGGMGAWGEV